MSPQRQRPTRQQHIDQANANEQLSHRLQSTDPEWALTTLFYAAVHWMSAYLGDIGLYPTTHALRRIDINRRPELARVRRRYFFLQAKSVAARYDCVPFSAQDVARIRAVHFVPLKQALQALLIRSPPSGP